MRCVLQNFIYLVANTCKCPFNVYICLFKMYEITTTSLHILYSHLARLWSPCCSSAHCPVPIPKLPTSHHQGYSAKLPSPLHPMDCPNELQAAQKFEIFWAVKCLNFCLPKFLPKNWDCPWFFSFVTGCLGSPAPTPFFPLLSAPSLSLFFTGWVFKA